MNGKVFIAFLIGLAVASGVTYYLTSKPEPVKTAAVQQPPAEQAPAPASTDATAEQPAQPAAQDVKPSPVEPAPAPARRESRAGSHTARSSRPAHSTATHASPATSAAAQTPKSPESLKPVETASSAPAPAPVSAPPAAPAATPETTTGSYTMPPPPPKPNTVTIPAGTLLTVRLNETLNSERNHEGDSFTATLDQPLVVDGFVVAERGAKAQGRVVQSLRSGRVEGLAKLGLELVQLTTADGQKVRINTGAFERQAETTKKKDAAKVGIGAALGAAIGAMAGGGKGAAIGAGVGGAAGAGDVLMTRGKPAELPVETRVSFRMRDPVTVTEQLH